MRRETWLVPLYENELPSNRRVRGAGPTSPMVCTYVVSADLLDDSKPLKFHFAWGVREWLRSPGGRRFLNLKPGVDDSPGLTIAEVYDLPGDARAALEHVLNVVCGVRNVMIERHDVAAMSHWQADDKIGVYSC